MNMEQNFQIPAQLCNTGEAIDVDEDKDNLNTDTFVIIFLYMILIPQLNLCVLL